MRNHYVDVNYCKIQFIYYYSLLIKTLILGASHVGRSLLSIDQLYTYEEPGANVPLKLLILMLAGAVILVAASSLCADCNKTKAPESM